MAINKWVGVSAIVGVFLLLLLGVGTGAFAWFAELTGFATSGSASLNVTIQGTSPVFVNITNIGAVSLTEGSSTDVVFDFRVSDADGVGNLNHTGSSVVANYTSFTDRENTSCSYAAANATDAIYTCTLKMWYWDSPGDWELNLTFKDIDGNVVSNLSLEDSNFSLTALKAMVFSPIDLTWPSLSVMDTDIGSNNDPILINNTGNVNITQMGNISVKSADLYGETNPSQAIYAENFSIGLMAISQGCGAGSSNMSNATFVNITGSLLPAGNNSINTKNGNSGQEELYFCIRALNPDLTSQSYSTAAGSTAWTIRV